MTERPHLSRLLHEVAAVPPPPSGYAADLRRTAALRRSLRLGGTGAVAVVVVAAALAAGNGSGTGAVLEATRSTSTAAPTPAATTPAPTPARTTAAPAPKPTPTRARPTAAPRTSAPAPPPTAAPSPTRPPRTAAPRPTPAPRRTTRTSAPAPQPTWAPRGLVVRLSAPSSAADGSSVRFTVSIQDNDGHVLSGRVDFGDGSSASFTAGPTCGASSGRQPERLDTSVTRSHTYLGPGSYTAQVTVTTGSSCRDTPRETRTDTTTVDVG